MLRCERISNQKALTFYQAPSEEQVKMCNEASKEDTHIQLSLEGRTCQDMEESNQALGTHPLSSIKEGSFKILKHASI
jgi:hypothetical protein